MMSLDGEVSLLSLPPEVRQMIWEYVFCEMSPYKYGAKLEVKTDRPLMLVQEPRLHQVCRVLREDALIYHHGRYDFDIRTNKIFDAKWAQKNGLRLDLVRRLTVHNNAALKSLVLSSSAKFPALRKLSFVRANPCSRNGRHGFGYRFSRVWWVDILDMFTTYLSQVPDNFDKDWDHDLLLAYREVETILERFPQFSSGTALYFKHYWRLSNKEFSNGDQQLHFYADPTPLPVHPCPWALRTIDLAVLAPHIDEGIAQMRDGRMPATHPRGAKQNYQDFEDFVERGLVRKRLVVDRTMDAVVASV